MNVLLVQPPLPALPGEPKHLSPPLGLAYIAAALREAGAKVEILDCALEGYGQQHEWGEFGPHYGLGPKDFLGRVSDAEPSLIGISCLFSTVGPVVSRLAGLCRSAHPNTPVVAGGSHATVYASELLASRIFDFVVRGEGEFAMVALLESLRGETRIGEIPNLSYLIDGVPVHSPVVRVSSLDDLPIPARDLLSMDKYMAIGRMHGESGRGRRATTLITSRGCPFDCVYCSIHPLWGYQYRVHSVERILTEIEQLITDHSVDHVLIEDDNLTLDKRRSKRLFREWVHRFPKLTWAVPNGVFVGALDAELLELFARTGCQRLTLAVESGCQDTLDRIIRKPIQLEKVLEVVGICNDLGIRTTAFFVVGLPGETQAAMEVSMEFAARLPVSSISIMAACPYPGTELARVCDENGYYCEGFDPNRVYTLHPQIETSDFSPEYVSRLIASTRLAHAFRHPLSTGRRVMEKAMVAPIETARAVMGSLKRCVPPRPIA